jgi:putative membrane protein
MIWGNAMGFGWIFRAVIILGAVWFLTYLLPSNAAGGRDRRPIEILKERFVRGGISREEYEEKRKALTAAVTAINPRNYAY